MSDKSNQNISELMDGELSNDCSRFLLKRMQSDQELRSSWNNYHMLRSSLQREHNAPIMQDLGSLVVEQLQRNEIPPMEQTKTPNKWLKAFSGTAIAASVALVAVFTFNTGSLNSSDNDTMFAKTSPQIINPPNAMVARKEQPLGFSRYPSLTPHVQQYINESNNEGIPVYYNAEYVNRLRIQSALKHNSYTAEE